MAQAIVSREGGYVNDPDDPGGATNYGVTIGTLRQLGLDLDRDGSITTADVRALSRDRAVDIYLDRYFHGPRIAELPEILWETVFDMQVNAGNNAIKILQRLLTRMGLPTAADGVIGPATIAAAQQAAIRAPDHLADAYGIARRNYYFALADSRPASRKYARTRAGSKGGWITRAEHFIAPKYHMTEQEFRKRTSPWV
jgi:lysozyme family protein